ncbi:MAG: AAA domain-containing protein [Lewinella sp.]|jgi:hypothetical protein|uniref:DEAD/DEAH box helicase n=1 Tax=Lewinella sp. TaxID=2004506 RepID=UPI003D6ABC3E
MANALPAITQYLRACYQADYRAVNLLNFFSTKANHQHLFADEAFLQGTLETLPVDTDWASSLSKHIYLHGKEEQLYVHALFLVGRTQLLGKQRTVCAPLYLIPAELNHLQEVYQVSLDFSGMVINPAVADVLQELNIGNIPSLLDHLNNILPTGPLDFDHLHALELQLASIFPDLVLNDLDAFPKSISEQSLKQSIRKQKEGFTLLPHTGLAMMQKASGSLGILNELETIAQGTTFSPVLQELFTNDDLSSTNKKQTPTPLPVLLSNNQKAILQAAATQTITMVNGPPGTGKSFTIAAIAADRLSQGESVLIAAKNPQAVEVIADKLERDFQLPGIAIRATRKDYRKHLRRRLKDWLNGLGVKYVYPSDQKRIKIELDTFLSQTANLEDILALRADKELIMGKLMTKDSLSWRERFQRWRLRRAFDGITPMWELHQQLEQASHKLQHRSRKHLEGLFSACLTSALRTHRNELQQTWEALKSKTGNQKERYFNQINFRKLLSALPVWLVDSSHIQEVLPLEASLFDLVIIDEASQSDMASAFPLLQRAKRAVIVGDPKQLRHVSFLSRERQLGFAQRFQLPATELNNLQQRLSYRDHSLLDLVSNRIKHQQNIILLDEHFRSLPGIINFSNVNFYRSQLKIMTAHPHNHAQKCIFLHRSNGDRDASGHNIKEAEAILRKIRSTVDQERELDSALHQSIGLLSPFRAQVDFLRKAVKEAFSAEELARHRILIGTPHDFQGEERDLMLISWVVDATTPAGTYRYLAKENVFNVSITRARAAQYMFLSVDVHQLPVDHLLTRYLQTSGVVESTPAIAQKASFDTDPFLEEVSQFIAQQGTSTILENYPIAGLEIDLVVVHQNHTYCIDLIGFPGVYEMALPLERWRMLERLGIPCFSLPYSQWINSPEESRHALKTFLSIKPK